MFSTPRGCPGANTGFMIFLLAYALLRYLIFAIELSLEHKPVSGWHFELLRACIFFGRCLFFTDPKKKSFVLFSLLIHFSVLCWQMYSTVDWFTPPVGTKSNVDTKVLLLCMSEALGGGARKPGTACQLAR